jgi:putative hydrolase of the HAD superfamily
MKMHNFTSDELLVIGDDPESEIKAGTALGIDTFLFDPADKYPYAVVTHRFRELKDVLNVLKLN